MKYLKYKCLLAIILGCSLSGCFDLTEEVFRPRQCTQNDCQQTFIFQIFHNSFLYLVIKGVDKASGDKLTRGNDSLTKRNYYPRSLVNCNLVNYIYLKRIFKPTLN